MLVGLNVSDDAVYDQYRAAMKPLLVRYNGGFRHDFRIKEVLKSEASHNINRVFTIYFPDEAAMTAFFSDSEYKAIKKQYFEASVLNTSILAAYQRP
jgi:uncharacterized protein (DUF1330 family)